MNKEPAKLDEMIEEMLVAANRYCEAAGIKLTTLGGAIMSDGKFFGNLRETNNCTIKTYRKVMRWLKDHRHVQKPNQKLNGRAEVLTGVPQ